MPFQPKGPLEGSPACSSGFELAQRRRKFFDDTERLDFTGADFFQNFRRRTFDELLIALLFIGIADIVFQFADLFFQAVTFLIQINKVGDGKDQRRFIDNGFHRLRGRLSGQ